MWQMAHQSVRQIPRPRVTWAEYQLLPEDGRRYEVLEGQLVVTPAPDDRHQSVSCNIEYHLEDWRRKRGDRGRVFHAPFDVILADDTIVQPDILYVSERTRKNIQDGRLHGPPDLVVEIFNRGGAGRDRVSKLQIYVQFGVQEYWLVDLEARTLTMLALREDGTYEQFAAGSGEVVCVARVLREFSIRPSDAFEDV